MGRSFIRVRRARAAMQLVGEVRELGLGGEAARRHLMTGLLRLVGGAVGGGCVDTSYGRSGGVIWPTAAGFDDTTAGVLDALVTGGPASNPYCAAMPRQLARRGTADIVVARHQDVVPTAEWRRSPFVNDVLRPAGLDHFLGSLRRTETSAVELLGFMRERGDRPFDEEDLLVLELVHHGCGAVFPTWNASRPLAPRVRETLGLLLEGYADKEIATELGISPHTVRQYVKTIYRSHGVSGRAQLLARKAGSRATQKA